MNLKKIEKNLLLFRALNSNKKVWARKSDCIQALQRYSGHPRTKEMFSTQPFLRLNYELKSISIENFSSVVIERK